MANDQQDVKQDDPKKRSDVQEQAAKEQKPVTQDELMEAFEGMVQEAEATGRRDEPAVVRARSLLDRRAEGKDASKKG